MTTIQAYNLYKIPPNLQEHMFRVAGIARIICDNWKEKIDFDLVIKACLVHDMGNLLKFDLVNKSSLLGAEQKNIERWKKIKEEMTKKYGTDEHLATSAICKEIEIEPKILWIVENWGFGNFEKVSNSNNWEYKICVYSDHRIGPFGVVSLEQRFTEQRKRYALQNNSSTDISAHLSSKDKYENLVKNALNVERQIQNMTNIQLSLLTDLQVQETINFSDVVLSE